MARPPARRTPAPIRPAAGVVTGTKNASATAAKVDYDAILALK